MFLFQKQHACFWELFFLNSFDFYNRRTSWHLKILAMNRVEKTQNCWGDCWFELFLLINAQDNLPPFPEIFFVQILRIIVWSFRTAELDVSNTDRNTEFFFWANTNEVSRITTDSTPLKFLCTGWHSVGQSGMPFTASDFQGCLQVCRRFSALPSPLVPPPPPPPPSSFSFSSSV